MITIYRNNPIIHEIKEKYIALRRSGENRANAIVFIREKYNMELQDSDDRIAVLIGLLLALCQKNEMTIALAEEIQQEIRLLRQKDTLDLKSNGFLFEIEQRLQDHSAYGPEAHYKKATKYSPNWNVGDLFAHEMEYPTSEQLGIKGWYILMYKVGDHIDELGKHRHLMYIALCPPKKLPTCIDEFKQLRFLPMMTAGNKAEYLAQISIKRKKDEEGYALSKIGSYPDIPLPNNFADENPLTAMPLWGQLRSDDKYPSYEDQLCRIYREYLHWRNMTFGTEDGSPS